jgi:hypothetical protein
MKKDVMKVKHYNMVEYVLHIFIPTIDIKPTDFTVYMDASIKWKRGVVLN